MSSPSTSSLRRLLQALALGLILMSIWLSLPALEGGSREIDMGSQFLRLAQRFFPPDLSVLPEVGRAFFETFQIATLATLFAVVSSILLAALSIRETAPWPLRYLIRVFLSAVRTIPSLIWAVLVVAMVGPTPRSGVIALTLYSVGYLGRFFLETLDASDRKPALWLSQHGAGAFQVFQYSLWPNIKSSLASQSLWMWEYNIRSASIIGYVGAGGLGLQLHIYQEYGQWNRFSTVLLFFFAVVITLELVSAGIRRYGRIRRN